MILSICFVIIWFSPPFQLCLLFSGAKGGGQEIKESPGGSPSINISVGASEKKGRREREKKRGVRVASALGSCSSSLFQCCGCYFVPALPFLMNQLIFLTLMWAITAVKKENIITSKSVLFCSIVHFQGFFRLFSLFTYHFFRLWVAGDSTLQTIVEPPSLSS